MRILMINYEYPPIGGGGGYAAQALGREYARAGHRVCLVTSGFRGLPRRENDAGIEVIRAPAWRRRIFFCSFAEMLSFVLSASAVCFFLAAARRFDAVHVFFGIPDGPIGWLLKATFGVPYCITMGGGDIPGGKPDRFRRAYRFLTPLVRFIWRSAGALVVMSEGNRALARTVDRKAKPLVIPNGVDPSRFGKTRTASEHFRILTACQLIERKGVAYLLEAFARLRQQFPDARLTIIGDGPKRKALQEQARAIPGEKVHFAGRVSPDRLAESYFRADLFVLPSLAEGMPTVLLEAMAAGLPLVATDVSGSRELVRKGENGFLVPSRDAGALADAMAVLAGDPKRCAAMGANSVRRAGGFTWSLLARRYMEILEGMRCTQERASGRRRPTPPTRRRSRGG